MIRLGSRLELETGHPHSKLISVAHKENYCMT
jgi:hypothetical protein